MKPATIIFSGGPDSTAASLWAISAGYTPQLLTFQFRNESQYAELSAAIEIARILKLEHTIFDFKSPMAHFGPDAHIMMHAGSDHHKPRSTKGSRLKFGAGLTLAVAANFALHHEKHELVWGATKDDALGGASEYTQEFSNKMAELITVASGVKFAIHAPLAHIHKHEIVSKFYKRKRTLFRITWSCKAGGNVQCGECHACIARRVAARLADVPDNTHYLQNRIRWPLSDSQLKNPASIAPSDLARILDSETPM